MNIIRLPDAELEVMLIVWKANKAVNASSVLEQLQSKRKWGLATLMTVLGRLVNKGFLVCQKQGRNNFYRPAISEEEYKAHEGKSMLARLYGNSFTDLIVSLYYCKAIDAADLAELRKFLDQSGKEED